MMVMLLVVLECGQRKRTGSKETRHSECNAVIQKDNNITIRMKVRVRLGFALKSE